MGGTPLQTTRNRVTKRKHHGRAKPQLASGTKYVLDPALDFLQRLWALNHVLERMSLQMERVLGVTAQQRLIIRCVGKYPGITASELSQVLHLDRGTLSVSLRRLAAKGLVGRRRDEADSRRVTLRLTRRGSEYDRPHVLSIEASVIQLLKRSGGGQVNQAKRLLDELSDELERRLR